MAQGNNQKFTIKMNPIEKFSNWFEEAKNCPQISDPTEICVATADKNGKPSARILLLKKFDERGFVFFTNYNGRKSLELKENPFASICIYWPALDKQIRIEGEVEVISATESDEYFSLRPRESRIGAITSKQSQKLESREFFLNELEETRKKLDGQENIKRPDNWGGWRLKPDVIEFWKAEEFRFHNREVFTKNIDGSWNKKLLYP